MVDQDPRAVADGADPQLDAAVAIAMQALQAAPPEQPRQPPYPVYPQR